jgi:hypothetical protein
MVSLTDTSHLESDAAKEKQDQNSNKIISLHDGTAVLSTIPELILLMKRFRNATYPKLQLLELANG